MTEGLPLRFVIEDVPTPFCAHCRAHITYQGVRDKETGLLYCSALCAAHHVHETDEAARRARTE